MLFIIEFKLVASRRRLLAATLLKSSHTATGRPVSSRATSRIDTMVNFVPGTVFMWRSVPRRQHVVWVGLRGQRQLRAATRQWFRFWRLGRARHGGAEVQGPYDGTARNACDR